MTRYVAGLALPLLILVGAASKGSGPQGSSTVDEHRVAAAADQQSIGSQPDGPGTDAKIGPGAVRLHKRRAVRHPSPPASLDPPQAASDSYTTAGNTTLDIAAPGILANDTVNQAKIASYGINGTEQTTAGTATATEEGGTVSVASNGGFTYDPANGFSGTDAFKYVLTNSGGSSTGQVSIVVLPPPPVAVDDSYSTSHNAQLSQPAPGVLENDNLSGGSIVSYGESGAEQTVLGTSTLTVENGHVTLNADGSFSYTPANDFSGNDSFRYVVANDGGTSTGMVTIEVAAAAGPDFVVTSPGFSYSFSGVPGSTPVLTLQRGRTYVFEINTALIHPFEIQDAPPGSVTNNNISHGTLTFAVPAGPGTYHYHCSIHDFGNNITTVP